MKPINENVLHYMHKIQDLATKSKKVNIYYQADIYLLSVYSLKKDSIGYEYHKKVYIDGYLSSYDQVIRDLKDIIRDLEVIVNESNSKNKLIRK